MYAPYTIHRVYAISQEFICGGENGVPFYHTRQEAEMECVKREGQPVDWTVGELTLEITQSINIRDVVGMNQFPAAHTFNCEDCYTEVYPIYFSQWDSIIHFYPDNLSGEDECWVAVMKFKTE